MVQGILLVNVLVYPPKKGYDGKHHLRYLEALSKGRLPDAADTWEFFSPPAPYAIPAATLALDRRANPELTRGKVLARHAKLFQLQNWVFSGALGVLLVALARRIRPGSPLLAAGGLALMGALPVYHKSFTQVRGEPALALLTVLAAVLALRAFGRDRVRWPAAVGLGVALGLAVLSRQWGFFLFPAGALWAGFLAWKDRGDGDLREVLLGPRVRALVVAGLVSVATGAWFYLHLLERYGHVTAFNRPPSRGFSLEHHPPGFLSDLALGELVTDPVRPSFPGRAIPIFYSEIWGDYWSFFHVYGRHREDGRYVSGGDLEERLGRKNRPAWMVTNRESISPYLGRVNAVAVLPTLWLLAGLASGIAWTVRWMRSRDPDEASRTRALLTMVILFTAGGYLWFVIQYPNPIHGKADTIKATYLLSLVPLVALLAMDLALALWDHAGPRGRRVLGVTALAMVAALLHSAPLLLTRYVEWQLTVNLLSTG